MMRSDATFGSAEIELTTGSEIVVRSSRVPAFQNSCLGKPQSRSLCRVFGSALFLLAAALQIHYVEEVLLEPGQLRGVEVDGRRS